MPQTVTTGPITLTPGSYQHEIDAQPRKDGAVITMERSPEWPAGALFDYEIYERDRTTGALTFLTGASESGGPMVGRDGTVNPPLRIQLSWPVDKAKDLIQFRLTVHQTFGTNISLAFL